MNPFEEVLRPQPHELIRTNRAVIKKPADPVDIGEAIQEDQPLPTACLDLTDSSEPTRCTLP
jgi:hypothetical protein